MSATGPHRIAISMGDPAGIGAEVIVKALQDTPTDSRTVILGLGSCLTRAAEAAGIAPFWAAIAPRDPWPDAPVVLIDDERAPGGGVFPQFAPRNSALCGALSLAWVRGAIELASLPAGDPRRVHAVVTGPISKTAWNLAGEKRYPGHTELFADAFGVRERHAMMFVGPLLNVILVTAHLPLARVPASLTTADVLLAIELGNDAMKRLGCTSPRIAVCGLNPHAGEEGLLGAEDAAIIAPAVTLAAARGLDAKGPFPADTLFLRAVDRKTRPRDFDLVVAMYHDQGLIPLKLLQRDTAINLTVGLPVPRTSPDHGTAFDIAGKNLADPGSMRAAIDTARRLATPAP